ncbi:putative TIM-barrel fold metal-dependent hydrolase [Hoeflea marina]|uniref:Putative TIM-barrel fold metal-dependent hydrolase n=1 Tax=Hoeflea marina TaxID=274592 RepID=A0A317PGH6_9HYPH|nr:amidohydrolase family protein [Hoeflea marina]PWV97761.1 putative TIM-barrel fold metal-dependent hydrolase [Hoeflea marina]
MKIIDAHQHFWDITSNYLPWLCDAEPLPNFRYGDYSALRRNYMPADYRRDSEGFEVIGGVFVETEWDPGDPLGEIAWVKNLAAREALPSVAVGQAWLDRGDAPELLAAYGADGFLRGIRHKPRAVGRPEAVEPGAPGSMGDPAWRRGFRHLAPNGLSFDLQTPWWHLAEARQLADDHGDTVIILNHTGLPSDRSPEGLKGWREALALFAGAPNTLIKISGIGVPGSAWPVEANRPVVLDAIELFGTGRAMFASNFPVDSLVATYREIYSGFDRITGSLTASEREDLFWRTAAEVYRVPLEQPASKAAE